MWGCFLWCSTYHCYGVDRVHDGEQQDVVLGKVPIVYRTSCNTECELSDEGKKIMFPPTRLSDQVFLAMQSMFFFKFGCCFLYKMSYMCHRINAFWWVVLVVLMVTSRVTESYYDKKYVWPLTSFWILHPHPSHLLLVLQRTNSAKEKAETSVECWLEKTSISHYGDRMGQLRNLNVVHIVGQHIWWITAASWTSTLIPAVVQGFADLSQLIDF